MKEEEKREKRLRQRLIFFLSWKRLLEFFYFKLRKDIKTLGNIRELWSDALNLTLNICQVTSSGA